MTPIIPASSIPSIAPSGATNKLAAAGKTQQNGFADLVGQFVKDTNNSQVQSGQSVNDLITGKTDNVQQVVLAVANAEMSFQLFMELRNKLIESYNELMRMQF